MNDLQTAPDWNSPESRVVKIHGDQAFAGMRKAGLLAAEVLDFVTPFVKPGVSTDELDRMCHQMIIERGAIPAPLGYRGFPKSICTSVNHVVCHGIPTPDKVLNDGDIINIDVTVIDDVAVVQHLIRRRDTVAHHMVDRGADRLREAAIAERGGDGAALDDHLVAHAVELVGADAGFHERRDEVEHFGGQEPRLAHAGKGLVAVDL